MFNKYVDRAKEMVMINAMLISSDDICIDIRANLKCAWGCDRSAGTSLRCDNRDTTFAERVEIIKKYTHVLLLHSNNAVILSRTLLDLEKTAFLDGYYFASALRCCHLCEECAVNEGKACSFPTTVRPCDQLFGIDVYKTVRHFGLPCEVLQDKEDTQNSRIDTAFR